MAKLKLFVISDIHAGDAHGKDTYVANEPPPARPTLHPLSDLVKLVEEQAWTADYLIVPGDIANRADTAGLAYGWTKVQQLGRSLGARILGAPGNHDVVTREPSTDPREALKQLLPAFPTGELGLDNRFWSDGYCVVEEHDHRIVIVDSTADFPSHPGTFSSHEDEERYFAAINRGGIGDPTLAAIEREIASMDAKLNILVVHHHPLEHQLRSHMRDWHGPMRNGDELVSLLSSPGGTGRWLIIHGHKHIPQLVQDVRVSATGPVVLCAASLGHHLWAPVTSFIHNQFHIVTVTDERVPGVGSFTGNIATFNWGYSIGWRLAPSDSAYLPPSSGFGFIGEPKELAALIQEHMEGNDVPILRRGDLGIHFPMVDYLAPLDRALLERELLAIGLRLEADEQGAVDQISLAVQAKAV